ncbi:hypothetical protein TRSC58_05142 [Trypanosoma rangeli SC58]|uniref:Uncharacterized protein n=1 Tax=Trypanosoma rangeli SC58 TaxID=429131 RepID=A0A061IYM3_TRYRA|nr:hypothetical protein TRSC58_05142 [Trypanosoma rangeli SC58]
MKRRTEEGIRSTLLSAEWAVKRILSSLTSHNEESVESGSCSKTSTAAPRMMPSRSARARSSPLVVMPRPMLMYTALGFIMAKRCLLKNSFVSSVPGRVLTTKSDSRITRSRSASPYTMCAPCWSFFSEGADRLTPVTSIPNAMARRAVACPMSP